MPIQFTFRCPIDWNSMEGDDTRRFCGQCSKHVTNISNMTPKGARAFLDSTVGANVCITASSDELGRVRFRDGAVAMGAAAIMIASGPAMADGNLPTLPDTVDTTVEDIADGGELADVQDTDCESATATPPIPDMPMPGGMVWIPPTPVPTPPPTPVTSADGE